MSARLPQYKCRSCKRAIDDGGGLCAPCTDDAVAAKLAERERQLGELQHRLQGFLPSDEAEAFAGDLIAVLRERLEKLESAARRCAGAEELLVSTIKRAEKAEAEVARLREALGRIDKYEEQPFDWPQEWWAAHTPETCAECKRWDEMKHLIQNRCEEYSRLFYSRRDRREHQQRSMQYRLKDIARAALNPSREEPGEGRS